MAITALTEIGAVTANILGFNSEKRLLERQTLQSQGRYPTAAAAKLIRAAGDGR